MNLGMIRLCLLQTMNLGMIGPFLFITDNESGYDRSISVGSGGASSHHNQSDVDRFHLESPSGSGGQSNHGFPLGQVYLPTMHVVEKKVMFLQVFVCPLGEGEGVVILLRDGEGVVFPGPVWGRGDWQSQSRKKPV